MEFTRKVEVKSEESDNRMPSIVEAGALAVATTIKPHSLTSNNEITSPNNESFHYKVADGLLVEPMPLSSGIPKRPSPGNTNIRDIWTKSLVLMVLIATSGFLMWNGKKWIFSYKKIKEEEKDEVSSDLSENEADKYAKEQIWNKLLSLLNSFDELLKTHKVVQGYNQPDNQLMFFLAKIERIWKQLGISFEDIKGDFQNDEFKRKVAKATLEYMEEFSKLYPDFAKVLDGTKMVREYWIKKHENKENRN